MSPAARRAGVLAAAAGLAVAQVAVASAYLGRGTWWHYLLHQMVGWGLGLAVAAAVGLARPGRLVPPLPAAVVGQLVSIVPDLMFKYMRMPHTPAMDWWVGHISIHRGPSPVLVALAVLLLGSTAWQAAALGRRRPAAVLAVAGPVLLTVACLVASPLPHRLSEY